MAITMQSIVDSARVPLNDADKVTWTDSELFGYSMHGLRLLKSRRADLYFGLSSTVLDTLVIDGNFPLDDGFAPAVQDYVTARAQFKDDESAVKGSASAFYKLFAEAI